MNVEGAIEDAITEAERWCYRHGISLETVVFNSIEGDTPGSAIVCVHAMLGT